MFFAKRRAVTSFQTPKPEGSEEASTTAPLPVLTTPSTGLTLSLDGRTVTSGLNPLTGSTTNRVPIIIKKELKRPEPLPPRSRTATHKHTKRLWILGTLVLVTTIMATLLITTPAGQELSAKFTTSQMAPSSSLIANKQGNNAAQVAALATTTYMYQNDGYDPYSHGEVNVSDGTSSLPWPYGQCTYWANYRYHQLTHFWVQWTGNADQWFLGAQKAGWDYAQTPPPDVPSIIVLMPYVQGAGWLGHVAVVESQSGNVVHTSNMNWGYGGNTHVEDVDFTIGAGVYFVWHKPTN